METCRTCGSELGSGVKGGFCPRCLFGTALAELAEGPGEETPDWRMMGEFLDGYEFVGEIGRGGMGAVYEAVEKAGGERVAVKVLAPALASNPELVERFRREAEVMSGMKHERIVKVRTWGERKGLLFLVMEFVEGGDVAGVLRERGPLALEDAVGLLDDACEGLAFSHGQGVLHRDLKPGNLLVDGAGRVKVGDFGLAKVLGQESDYHLTMTNAAMGTPRYMAPEQMGGAGSVDARTDVYALGVVFYEMVTGRLPGGNFPLPSELVKLGERVDELVLRAMSEDPAGRHPSVEAFRAAMNGLVKKGRGRGWPWVAGLVLLLGGGVGWMLRDEGTGSGGGEGWELVSEDGALPDGVPERIDGVRVLRVSDAARVFGVALLEDGSLMGFGDDAYGQGSPPDGEGFVAVAVGRGERAAHGVALRSDGTVVAWGDDSFGQARVPAGLAGVVRVQAGEFWSAAMKEGGEVVRWGKVDGEAVDWDAVGDGVVKGRRVE